MELKLTGEGIAIDIMRRACLLTPCPLTWHYYGLLAALVAFRVDVKRDNFWQKKMSREREWYDTVEWRDDGRVMESMYCFAANAFWSDRRKKLDSNDYIPTPNTIGSDSKKVGPALLSSPLFLFIRVAVMMYARLFDLRPELVEDLKRMLEWREFSEEEKKLKDMEKPPIFVLEAFEIFASATTCDGVEQSDPICWIMFSNLVRLYAFKIAQPSGGLVCKLLMQALQRTILSTEAKIMIWREVLFTIESSVCSFLSHSMPLSILLTKSLRLTQ